MGRAYKTLPLYPRYLSLPGTKVLWILGDRCVQIMYKNLWLSEVKISPKLQLPLKLKHSNSPVSENEGREGSGTPEPMQPLTECFLPPSLAFSPLWGSSYSFDVAQNLFAFWVLVWDPHARVTAVLQVVAQNPEA